MIDHLILFLNYNIIFYNWIGENYCLTTVIVLMIQKLYLCEIKRPIGVKNKNMIMKGN